MTRELLGNNINSKQSATAGQGSLKPWLVQANFTAIYVGVILCAYGMWSLYCFGDLSTGCYFMLGSVATMDSVYLRSVDSGSEHDVAFEVKNLGTSKLKIMGGRTSCKCLKLHGLPLEIEPRGEAVIPATLLSPVVDKSTELVVGVLLYVAHADGSGIPPTAALHATVTPDEQ